MIHVLHLLWILPITLSIGYMIRGIVAVRKRDDEVRREIVERREADWREKIIELHEER